MPLIRQAPTRCRSSTRGLRHPRRSCRSRRGPRAAHCRHPPPGATALGRPSHMLRQPTHPTPAEAARQALTRDETARLSAHVRPAGRARSRPATQGRDLPLGAPITSVNIQRIASYSHLYRSRCAAAHGTTRVYPRQRSVVAGGRPQPTLRWRLGPHWCAAAGPSARPPHHQSVHLPTMTTLVSDPPPRRRNRG
jgi:hypothetical protein